MFLPAGYASRSTNLKANGAPIVVGCAYAMSPRRSYSRIGHTETAKILDLLIAFAMVAAASHAAVFLNINKQT